MFPAKLDCHSDTMGLYNQDFILNKKKLINLIESPVRTLQFGADMVTSTHLDLVYNKFIYNHHGLKLEDTNKKDHQNWASTQRICQKQMLDCLAVLFTLKEVYKGKILWNENYLEVCSNYIDIFLSSPLELQSKVFLAYKGFFCLWKLWFQFQDHSLGGNTKKN